MKGELCAGQVSVISRDLDRGAAIIRGGGIVAFPTETHYGLAVNPFDQEALARLFRVKKRDLDNPILTIIEHESQISLLAACIPLPYHRLMSVFWPGPLTLLFDGLPSLPGLLTGNTRKVGMRISSNPVARSLVKSVGMPVTATSANISGRPASTNPGQVKRELEGNVDLIIDGGETPGGMSSTVVGADDVHLRLIRAGVIAFDEILKVYSGK